MKVKDHKGDLIEVGTRVVFGAPETPEQVEFHTGTVTKISSPDVWYAGEDEHGREQSQYGLEITVEFDDDEYEQVKAWIKPMLDWYDGCEEEFEANDDIEVIPNDEKEKLMPSESPSSMTADQNEAWWNWFEYALAQKDVDVPDEDDGPHGDCWNADWFVKAIELAREAAYTAGYRDAAQEAAVEAEWRFDPDATDQSS